MDADRDPETTCKGTIINLDSRESGALSGGKWVSAVGRRSLSRPRPPDGDGHAIRRSPDLDADLAAA